MNEYTDADMERDAWAVAHGYKSTRQHRIVTAQIGSTQAAACGYDGSGSGSWLPVDDIADRDLAARSRALPRCRRCDRQRATPAMTTKNDPAATLHKIAKLLASLPGCDEFATLSVAGSQTAYEMLAAVPGARVAATIYGNSKVITAATLRVGELSVTMQHSRLATLEEMERHRDQMHECAGPTLCTDLVEAA